MKLSAQDTALMDRLFGPRIPDEMAAIFEEAKAVDVADPSSDLSLALDILLRAIVHTGIGDGVVGGWRLYEEAGRTCLAVCRFNSAALKAA